MVPPPTPEIMLSSVQVAYRPLAPVVRTEARTIVITKLSHSVDENSLEALLRVTAGNDSHVKAEFAYHKSGEHKGERKDHALAVFDDARSAERAVHALNGYKFQGRCIAVKLAKEQEVVRPMRAHRQETYFAPPPQLSGHVSSSSSSKTEKHVGMRPSSHNDKHVGSSSALKIGIELSSRTPPVVDGSSPTSKRGYRSRSSLR
jgi:RNA recognition motif-containing protein